MKKLALAMVFVFGVTTAQAGCYSDGIRVGVVQKISKKGYISKSWEGELAMNNLNTWKFSVVDDRVAAVIEDAAMSGRFVALKYCQLNPILPHPGIDTDYQVVQAVVR